MNAREAVLGRDVLDDCDTAGVSSQNDVVCTRGRDLLASCFLKRLSQKTEISGKRDTPGGVQSDASSLVDGHYVTCLGGNFQCFKWKGERKHTFGASSQPEGRERPNDAKHVVSQQSDDLSLGGLWSQECQTRAGRDENLLLLGTRELAEDGMADCRRRLQRQRVEKHVRRGGRHVCGCGRKPSLSPRTGKRGGKPIRAWIKGVKG